MPHTTPQRCCWWLAGNKEQCGRKTGYKIVRDDGNKVRDYSLFCSEHQPMADEQASRSDSLRRHFSVRSSGSGVRGSADPTC